VICIPQWYQPVPSLIRATSSPFILRLSGELLRSIMEVLHLPSLSHTPPLPVCPSLQKRRELTQAVKEERKDKTLHNDPPNNQ
jgi:hypothetical protein